MHQIDTTELKRMLDEKTDVLLINTLGPEAFEQERIPGSVNVPSDAPNLAVEVEQLAGRKDRQIVVYCANPECHASRVAGRRLERAGFTDIAHYPGGMEEWTAAGHDVERGAPAGVR